jgi:hypothetical protein
LQNSAFWSAGARQPSRGRCPSAVHRGGKRGGVQLSVSMFQRFVVVVLTAPFLAPGLRRGNVAFTVFSGVHAGGRHTQASVAQPSVAASSRRRRGLPAGARGGRLSTRAPSALDGPTPASSADGSPARPPAPAVPPRRAVPIAAPDSPTATARPAAPIGPATRCAPRTDTENRCDWSSASGSWKSGQPVVCGQRRRGEGQTRRANDFAAA